MGLFPKELATPPEWLCDFSQNDSLQRTLPKNVRDMLMHLLKGPGEMWQRGRGPLSGGLSAIWVVEVLGLEALLQTQFPPQNASP